MGNKEKLTGFINQLNEMIGFTFNINDFNDRLKLQKYVFIARYFGYDHNYDYDLYIHGPYSSTLADDYYNLSSEKSDNINTTHLELDDNYFKLIKNKSIAWLESATTMLSLYGDYKNNYVKEWGIDLDRLINETHTIKHKIKQNIIISACFDLKDYNLFNI